MKQRQNQRDETEREISSKMEKEGNRWKSREEERKLLRLSRRYTMRKRKKLNSQTENFKCYEKEEMKKKSKMELKFYWGSFRNPET